MATLLMNMKPTESTTTRAKTRNPPKNQRSPSMILRTSSASRQKPYAKAVGDTPPPLGTPGNLQPEETSQWKSYAAILTSEAADDQVIPLGHENDAWLLLAITVSDPPPKLFVRPTDTIPPDITYPSPKRRQRSRRNHH